LIEASEELKAGFFLLTAYCEDEGEGITEHKFRLIFIHSGVLETSVGRVPGVKAGLGRLR